MIESLKKYTYIGALAYAFICFIDALFIPIAYSLDFDNYLFPFGFLHLVYVIIKAKKIRLFLLSFVMIFLWGVVVEYINNGYIEVTNLYQLFYFIKWPVLMSVFILPSISLPKIHGAQKIVDYIFLISAGLCIVMIINPFDLGIKLQSLFAPKDYINYIYYNKSGTYRLAGVFLNANDNALFLGAFVLYYLFYKTSENWFFVTLAILLFFVTQSRTVLIGLIFLSFIYIFQVLLKNRFLISKKVKWLVVSFFVILIGLMSISKNLESILTGEAFKSNSIMIRYNNLEHFMLNKDIDRLIGSGVINDPLKDIGIYIDSEIVSILIQFGYIGLILWLFLFILAFITSIRINSNSFLLLYFLLILLSATTNYCFLGGHSGVIISFFVAVYFYLNKDKIEYQ